MDPQYLPSFVEVPPFGIIASAMNGVPIYGTLEAQLGNAVEPAPDGIRDAQFWYGHAARRGIHHYHNPDAGVQNVDAETLLGYALDGFPLYGPLDNDNDLDLCNGRFVNGNYRYHVRTLEQVDESLEYCDPNGGNNTRLNYILGCYHGDTSRTVMVDNPTAEDLDFSQCIVLHTGDNARTVSPTVSPTTTPTGKSVCTDWYSN